MLAPPANRTDEIAWGACPNFGYRNTVCPSRKRTLFFSPSYDAILVERSQCTISGFIWEPGERSELKTMNRASFRLRVSSTLYDWFFNSPVGYRAQFAISKSTGLEANASALRTLESRMVEASVSHGRDRLFVTLSLRSEGAKIWIDESEVEGQMGRLEPAIDFERWEKNSEDGAGLLIPRGRYLEVKGAWITKLGEVFIDPYKRTRAEQIYECGFS